MKPETKVDIEKLLNAIQGSTSHQTDIDLVYDVLLTYFVKGEEMYRKQHFKAGWDAHIECMEKQFEEVCLND